MSFGQPTRPGHETFRKFFAKNAVDKPIRYTPKQFEADLRDYSLRGEDADVAMTFLNGIFQPLEADNFYVRYDAEREIPVAKISGKKFQHVSVILDLDFMHPCPIIPTGSSVESDYFYLNADELKNTEEFNAWQLAISDLENNTAIDKDGIIMEPYRSTPVADPEPTRISIKASTNRNFRERENPQEYAVERTMGVANLVEQAYTATRNLSGLVRRRREELADQLLERTNPSNTTH